MTRTPSGNGTEQPASAEKQNPRREDEEPERLIVRITRYQPFIDAVKEAFGRDFSAMPEETSAGELYLDSLAVEPAWQGQGIAKALLKATAERAARIGCGPVGLLVDSNNPRAERLYASVGFVPAGTNNWGGHPMKHMVLEAKG